MKRQFAMDVSLMAQLINVSSPSSSDTNLPFYESDEDIAARGDGKEELIL